MGGIEPIREFRVRRFITRLLGRGKKIQSGKSHRNDGGPGLNSKTIKGEEREKNPRWYDQGMGGGSQFSF